MATILSESSSSVDQKWLLASSHAKRLIRNAIEVFSHFAVVPSHNFPNPMLTSVDTGSVTNVKSNILIKIF